LQVGILSDRFDGFAIADTKALLDNQRTESNAEGFGGGAKLGIELVGVVVFEVVPGDELGEFDPTIVATEVATEG